FVPGVAAVSGFVEATARKVGGSVDRPGWTAGAQERGVKCARMDWIDGEFDGADVVGALRIGENFFPVCAAVGRAIDAAGGVGVVDMAECSDEDDVGIV